jgi:hypothetical protein
LPLGSSSSADDAGVLEENARANRKSTPIRRRVRREPNLASKTPPINWLALARVKVVARSGA